jgi:hypothetical protein
MIKRAVVQNIFLFFFMLFIIGGIITRSYMLYLDPKKALIQQVVSFKDSEVARWQVNYLLRNGVSPGFENEAGLTAYMRAFVSNDRELLVLFPQYMNKIEVIKAMDKVESWPTSDKQIKQTAIDSLSARLKSLN